VEGIAGEGRRPAGREIAEHGPVERIGLGAVVGGRHDAVVRAVRNGDPRAFAVVVAEEGGERAVFVLCDALEQGDDLGSGDDNRRDGRRKRKWDYARRCQGDVSKKLTLASSEVRMA
jgi:hypothetical protein